MKIMFVSEHYPPTSGGVATSAQRVARALQRMGIDVHVLTFDNSKPLTSDDYTLEEVDSGVRISRVGPFFLKHKDLANHPANDKAKAILRRRVFNQFERMTHPKADIVLSFYLLNAGYMAQLLAHTRGIPHVAGVRGNDIGRNIFSVERFGVIHWIVTHCSELACVNHHLLARLLIAFPEAASRSCIIANSVTSSTVDVPMARKRVAELTGWNDQDLRLVFIGTLREKKGVTTLLQSLDKMRSHKVKLLVIGPGISGLEARLCGTLWDELVKDRIVYITGWVDRDHVQDLAAGADIIAMPSLDDGMANGLLEGMACGLAPVVSNVFRDVVKENSGLFVAPGDADAFCEKILRLESNRTQLLELGRRAQLDVTCRTSAMEATEYIDVFQRLLRNQSNVGKKQ